MAWEAIWQDESEARAEIIAGSLAARGIRARTQGTGRLPMAIPGGLVPDTRIVFVRHRDARLARAHLHNTGEAANVVGGPDDDAALSREQAATLWFAVFGLVAVAGIVIYLFLRQAMDSGT